MLRHATLIVWLAVVMLVTAPVHAQDEPDTPVETEVESTPAPPAEEPAEEPAAVPDAPPERPVEQPTATPAESTPTPAPAVATPARRVRATTRLRSRGRRAPVSITGPEVPSTLAPWIGWALYDSPDVVCPDVAGVRTCRWPGLLRMQAGSGGATFAMEVWADREMVFYLPGNRDHWPQQIKIDGASPPVLGQFDVPAVEVPAGAHRIEGEFLWDEIPEMISVPTSVASVELSVEGAPSRRARVDGQGRLWLRDGARESSGENETDSVRASIYRRFTDGVPLVVTTRVRLNVSGKAREVELGALLLKDSRPVAVRAEIPVHVRADGQTKVYVRPGSHDVEIDAVLYRRTTELSAPRPAPEFYDPQEVWVWMPDEAVRSVELEGLTPVDPERTSLPTDWGGHTTFLAEPGAGLKLRVTRRGVEETQPNVVNLDRDLWLDLDGVGYTVRDRLSGTLHETWRLDYSGTASLGRVAQDGENLLITNEPDTEQSGVELRGANLNIAAELRLEEASSHLEIVGWDHDMQSLNARLHLPPGWTLLWGKGVDTMSGTWVSSWDLWDFFFVLLIGLVIGRLFGWQWAFVGIIAMCLAHDQPDAPKWVWVHLIVTLALLRVLPEGWARRVVVVYRWGALIFLATILAPFVHDQVLVAFHPQVSLARPHTGGGAGNFGATFDGVGVGGGGGGVMENVPAAAPMEQGFADEEVQLEGERTVEKRRPRRKMPESKGGKGDWLRSSSYDIQQVQLQQIDPNAVVQTGPGLPTWSWSTWRLQWSGPVRRDHTIDLYLLSPKLNGVLSLLRVVLLIFLGLLLLAPRDMYWDHRKPIPSWWRRLFGTGVPLLLAALIVGIPQREAAAAEVPSPEVLQQLRDRIDAASRCTEPCVVASDASIAVNGLDFEMTADVSAPRATGWTIPGPVDALRISSIAVDGRRTNQLRRVGDMVQVRLDPGAHDVVVVGTLADRNTVTVQFDATTRPRHVTFDSADWTVDGISPTGAADNSLQLTRTEGGPRTPAKASAEDELPPWYQVERLLALGMPWQLRTTVRRDDGRRPQLVKIPLVGSEKVITEGIRVEAGYALVDFARGQTEVIYVAELPIAEQVGLSAALDQPWTETWVVDCSRIWRCAFSDLPPVSTVADGVWRPRWQPWPGEALDITVKKPKGAKGAPKTVEGVKYDVTPDKRLMQASLRFTIRASQGDWQEITLPPDAELQSVTIDGQNRAIRPQDGVVKLPVQPGEAHYELRWQQPWERSSTERVPLVRIGSEAANVETTIHLGGERWLLRVDDHEMRWGPAVLFWWSLLLVALLACLLGLVPHMPLKWWEWGLLALGMSQMPFVAILPVVFWFLLLSWRGREDVGPWWRFDLLQLLILLCTLVAVGVLFSAVHTNFVVDIDMQVDGYGSSNDVLRWYSDRVVDTLPTPAVVSVPVLVYRLIMFLWAAWLVSFFIFSARWGWENFSRGGWWKFPATRKKQQPQRPNRNVPPPAPAAPPERDSVPINVARNATDGAIARAEFNLRGEPREKPTEERLEEETVDLTPPADLREDFEEAAAELAEPSLTDDDIIGALVDDSEVIEDEDIVDEKNADDSWGGEEE